MGDSCCTLTAEQVREVLIYNLPHREYFSIEKTDAWQAIADALNARLNTQADDYRQAAEYWQRMYEEAFAERTCRNISGVPLKFRCSECGDVLGKPSVDEFNYCPSCGRKVVGE